MNAAPDSVKNILVPYISGWLAWLAGVALDNASGRRQSGWHADKMIVAPHASQCREFARWIAENFTARGRQFR